MAVRIGKTGISHAHTVGWTNALRESLEVEFVGIFEPDPETIAVRSQYPANGGVRWLSEDELPGDRSAQSVFVETRPADNPGWARRALEAGKHISIDMAPSRSLNQLQEEFDLAQLGRMHVNMGYMFRFNPGLPVRLRSGRTSLARGGIHGRGRTAFFRRIGDTITGQETLKRIRRFSRDLGGMPQRTQLDSW